MNAEISRIVISLVTKPFQNFLFLYFPYSTIFPLSCRRFDRSNFPDAFLALKIVETQLSFLAPVFGNNAVLASGEGGSGTSPGAAAHDVTSGTTLITDLLKSVSLDTEEEVKKQFHAHYRQMFEPSILQSGISDFFDNAITQRIQSKARHIVNPRLDLARSDLFRTTAAFLNAGPPKTAFQVRKWR